MHVFVDYVKQGLTFARDLTPKNFIDHRPFLFSALIDTLSSYIDKFLSINPSNIFVFFFFKTKYTL